MNSTFQITKQVESDHIDDLGHVNNVVYLQWAQDVANLHWAKLKKGHDTSEFVWVVLRHEIDYKGQAVLNDELIIKTWVGDTLGIKSLRHIEIVKGVKPIVQIQTTWCLVDAETMKPRRITGDMLQVLQIHN